MRRPTILLWAILAGTTACRTPDAAEFAGDYTRQHRVYVFHGTEPVEIQVEDHLALQALAQRKLGFAFRITASAGQACEMSGIARVRRNGFEYRDTPRDGACTLRILKLGEEIALEDVDDSCRARYCGNGASIGRLAFASTE